MYKFLLGESNELVDEESENQGGTQDSDGNLDQAVEQINANGQQL